jgi:predicted DNA-binding transcriptional regulator YafY
MRFDISSRAGTEGGIKKPDKYLSGKTMANINRFTKENRAMEVWQLQSEGIKHSDIAKIFGITERTVRRDIKLAEQLIKRWTREQEPDKNLGFCLKTYQNLERLALKRFEETGESSFLNSALRAREKIVDLMQSTGAIIKLPDQVLFDEGTIPLEDDELRKEYLELLKKARMKLKQKGQDTS